MSIITKAFFVETFVALAILAPGCARPTDVTEGSAKILVIAAISPDSSKVALGVNCIGERNVYYRLYVLTPSDGRAKMVFSDDGVGIGTTLRWTDEGRLLYDFMFMDGYRGSIASYCLSEKKVTYYKSRGAYACNFPVPVHKDIYAFRTTDRRAANGGLSISHDVVRISEHDVIPVLDSIPGINKSSLAANGEYLFFSRTSEGNPTETGKATSFL